MWGVVQASHLLSHLILRPRLCLSLVSFQLSSLLHKPPTDWECLLITTIEYIVFEILRLILIFPFKLTFWAHPIILHSHYRLNLGAFCQGTFVMRGCAVPYTCSPSSVLEHFHIGPGSLQKPSEVWVTRVFLFQEIWCQSERLLLPNLFFLPHRADKWPTARLSLKRMRNNNHSTAT